MLIKLNRCIIAERATKVSQLFLYNSSYFNIVFLFMLTTRYLLRSVVSKQQYWITLRHRNHFNKLQPITNAINCIYVSPYTWLFVSDRIFFLKVKLRHIIRYLNAIEKNLNFFIMSRKLRITWFFCVDFFAPNNSKYDAQYELTKNPETCCCFSFVI